MSPSLPILLIKKIEPYLSKEPIYYQSIVASSVPQRACFFCGRVLLDSGFEKVLTYPYFKPIILNHQLIPLNKLKSKLNIELKPKCLENMATFPNSAHARRILSSLNFISQHKCRELENYAFLSPLNSKLPFNLQLL